MDLDIIKTVLAVAKAKSFSGAAFTIPCSQSSVSRRVEAAEKELGVEIFIRPSSGGSRNVELTEKAPPIIAAMNKVAEAYADLFYATSEAESSPVIFNLGIRKNMMAPIAVSLMKADFYETDKKISLSTNILPMNDMLIELYDKRLDAILFSCINIDRNYFQIPKGFKLEKLGKMKLFIGISDTNHLAKQDSILADDLRDDTFFLGNFHKDAVPGISFSSPGRFKALFGEGKMPKTKDFPEEMVEIRYKKVMENKGFIASYTPVPWRVMEHITYLPLAKQDIHTDFYLLYATGEKESCALSFAKFFSNQLEHE